ncbi:hypothetical protein GQ600_9656 [Phytophthora cactorum]|nr:hypothetical protein GQ600_9656 [Phytophthora cactorum]
MTRRWFAGFQSRSTLPAPRHRRLFMTRLTRLWRSGGSTHGTGSLLQRYIRRTSQDQRTNSPHCCLFDVTTSCAGGLKPSASL